MLKVVYVEDDEVNAFVFKRMLRDYCEVVHFRDGEDCLAQIHGIQPAVICLDINLGATKMDGIEVLKHLRAIDELKHTPFVAVTAFAFATDKENLLESGFDDYLSKPIRIADIQALVSKFQQSPPSH